MLNINLIQEYHIKFTLLFQVGDGKVSEISYGLILPSFTVVDHITIASKENRLTFKLNKNNSPEAEYNGETFIYQIGYVNDSRININMLAAGLYNIIRKTYSEKDYTLITRDINYLKFKFNQLNSFLDCCNMIYKCHENEVVETIIMDNELYNAHKNIPIRNNEFLPQRVQFSLMYEGFKTVGDMLNMSKRDLMRMQGIGIKAYNSIVEYIHSLGFTDFPSRIR